MSGPRVALELCGGIWSLRIDLNDAEGRHVRVMETMLAVNAFKGPRFEPLLLRCEKYGTDFSDVTRAFLCEIRRESDS